MDDLKTWLDNPSRDYFQGVALYQKYGADIRLKMRVFPYFRLNEANARELKSSMQLAPVIITREASTLFRVRSSLFRVPGSEFRPHLPCC